MARRQSIPTGIRRSARLRSLLVSTASNVLRDSNRLRLATLNLPAALGDLHRAVDGDANDSTYQFNLGAALWKNGRFDEAAKAMQAVLDRKPDDADAGTLLERAQDHESASSAKPDIPERLKLNFDATAFRQLKALLQPKGSE